MRGIIKDGPQLTGAEALDVILAKLDALTSVEPTGFGFIAGKFSAFQYVKYFVQVIRNEKFNDPPTEEPYKSLADSKSYGL